MAPTSLVARAVIAAVVVSCLLARLPVGTSLATTASVPRPQLGRPSVVLAAFVDVPAVALRQARRMRLDGTPIFPMQTTPRCDILDNFGDARFGGRRHEGSDMLATLGQEVYAATSGTLTQKVVAGSSNSSLSGNLWSLTNADGTYFVYAHLFAFAPGLDKGSVVERGQLIGYVGDTGNPGPGNFHLHFEVHPRGGFAVNPLPLLAIPNECSVH